MNIPAVLNINNYHYLRGGSDRYFLELSSMLKKEGHRVATFAARHSHMVLDELLAVPPPPGVDTERAGNMSNLIRYVFSSNARQRMMEAIAVFRPDIAHLHIYYGQLTASILAPLRRAGIPLVQTLHEYKLICPTHGLYAHGSYCDACKGRHYWHAPLRRCNRGSLARSALSMIEAYVSEALGAKNLVDHFIAVSEYQKRQLVRLGIPEHKLSVLYHFADVTSENRLDTGNYFLYVGRIMKDKGIATLLQAYAMMNKGRPRLRIAGVGDEIDHWGAYAGNLGISDDVDWLGFKDGRELECLYEGCRAVVNPSLLNETFGLSCLEALARGRPVIASRVGALSEVVSDNVDGLLVPPGDPSALKSAMERLWCNPSEALEKGRRGREKIKKDFSKKRHYESLMKIYRELG